MFGGCEAVRFHGIAGLVPRIANKWLPHATACGHRPRLLSIVILRLDRRIGFKSPAVDLKPLTLLALRKSTCRVDQRRQAGNDPPVKPEDDRWRGNEGALGGGRVPASANSDSGYETIVSKFDSYPHEIG